DEERERPDGGGRAGADARVLGALERLTEREPLLGGELLDAPHRRRPDAARGVVDDAADARRVVRVRDELEVGEGVLDLLARVEREAADDAVRDAAAPERVLDGAALRVRPVEDGDLAVGDAVADVEVADAALDLLRL